MEPQTKPEVRMNEVTYSHTFIPEVITVFPSPSFGEVPDLQNSSQRFYSGHPTCPPVAQGAKMIGISLGPPEMLGKYCLIRNQATLRVV
jgi:hypothetical protein